jgi:hypothetical protein
MLPLHCLPSAPPPDSVHDEVSVATQLRVNGVPIFTLVGVAAMEMLTAATTVTVTGVELIDAGAPLLAPHERVNVEAPTFSPL